jgi:GNAT superfamily N-acetyltransferase
MTLRGTRAREVVARRGIKGTANLVGERLSPTTDWRQDSVWYHLDLTDPERPRRPLEPPLELRQGHSVDVPLLEQFPVDTSVATMTRAVVEDRLAEGAILWMVVEGDRAAFRCWNFYATGPLPGGRRGRILVPPEIVMLEDSIANPEFRGRGVAPGAWTEIADYNAEHGMTTMITKVGVENDASRRAVEKAGFRGVALMHQSGPVWRPRLEIEFTDPDPQHEWLAALNR